MSARANCIWREKSQSAALFEEAAYPRSGGIFVSVSSLCADPDDSIGRPHLYVSSGFFTNGETSGGGGGRKNALAFFSTWQDVFLHWCWSHILTTNNILFAFILSRGRASTSLSGCLLTLFKSKLFKSHLAVRSNGSSMTDQGLLHNSIFFFFFLLLSLTNNGTHHFSPRLFGELQRENGMLLLISVSVFCWEPMIERLM